MVTAALVAPGHARAIPLAPEVVVPQDGQEKQDCESRAARRWLVAHGPGLARLKPIYLGAPRRRVSLVEEGTTQTVVGLIW